MTPDPGWSYNPGFAGPGDSKVFLPRNLKIRQSAADTISDAMAKFDIPKLETKPADIARAEIQSTLGSSHFEEAVAARKIIKWPMAIVSREIEDALDAAGAVTAAQVVTSKIKARKFTDHDQLSAERLRNVQDALDYGEVLIEPPNLRDHQGNRHTLITYYEEDGTWWRHVVEVERRRLALITVFNDHNSDVRTGEVLNRPGLKTVREWSEERWKNRPKARK